MPKVSVMIPTYGQADLVVDAVKSALAQDYPDMEVVVGDDCSPDQTTRAVKPFLSDPRLRYVRNPGNLGRVANYRRLLRQAVSGEWVLNLDGDDFLADPTYLSRAMALTDRETGLSLVFARMGRLDERTGRVRDDGDNRHLGEILDGGELFLQLPFRKIALDHLTCVYRRDAALELDFYRADIISSDLESLYRLLPGRKAGFVNTVAGIWREHGENATVKKDVAECIEDFDCLFGPCDHARSLGIFTREELDRWLLSMMHKKAFEDAVKFLRYNEPEDNARYMLNVDALIAHHHERLMRG